MDLDKVKENWKDIRPSIKEEEIYKILDKKGKTALGRLKTFEAVGLIILLILTPFPFIHNQNFDVQFNLLQKWYYAGFCVLAFFWQIYKLNLLSKIKPEKTDIHTSLKYITSYKRYIQYEIIVSLTWGMIFVIWFTITAIQTANLQTWWWLVLMVIFTCIITTAVVALLYHLIIKKNTKKIESSLQELKDFESENE